MAAKKTKTPKQTHHVTDDELAELARAASKAHDAALVKLVGRALMGNAKARRECARHVVAGRAIHRLHVARAEVKP